jgi:hypothetical protein
MQPSENRPVIKELSMMMRKMMCFSAVAALLTACGGPLEYKAVSSPMAPGAEASIEADVREDQKQTVLDIEIEHLPPAKRVEEGSEHYVAWYRRDRGEQWTRLAGLHYEEEDREASLRTSVPETKFDLWVTTERDLEAVSPSPNLVFEQRVGG